MSGRAGVRLLLVGSASVAVAAAVVNVSVSSAAGVVFVMVAGGGAGLAYGLAWRRYLVRLGRAVAEQDARRDGVDAEEEQG